MTRSSLRLLHITDTHLFAEADGRQNGINTRQTLSRVLARSLADPRPPDAILVTGDISQDESRGAYRHFRQALERSRLPVWCLPGNHDAPAFMAEELSGSPFQAGRALVHGEWCLLLLNSHLPGDHGGRLAPSEMEWLETSLQEHARHHVMLALHHHVLPVHSRWLDELGLYNADEFLAIIDQAPQVRCVVSGHVHQAMEALRRDVRYLTTPSTCYQFLPGVPGFAMDRRPPGFRWLDLQAGGHVATEVVWVDPD